MRDFVSRTVCSVVAQYDNDDGDGNMINCDIDDMIMVMLKKVMKAFKSITQDDEYKFEAVCEKFGSMRAQFKQTRARHQHAGNAKPYVTLFLNIRSNAYIVRAMKGK